MSDYFQDISRTNCTYTVISDFLSKSNTQQSGSKIVGSDALSGTFVLTFKVNVVFPTSPLGAQINIGDISINVEFYRSSSRVVSLSRSSVLVSSSMLRPPVLVDTQAQFLQQEQQQQNIASNIPSLKSDSLTQKLVYVATSDLFVFLCVQLTRSSSFLTLYVNGLSVYSLHNCDQLSVILDLRVGNVLQVEYDSNLSYKTFFVKL